MRLPLAAALLAAFLAGCSGGEPEPVVGSDDSVLGQSVSGSASPSTGPAPALPWIPESIPVSFDGNLGTSVHGCVFPVHACHTSDVTAGSTDIVIARPGARFTGLDVTLTWAAQTPATATLSLGYMVMGCPTCNDTSYEDVSGPSPLQATLSGADVPMAEDDVVHIYVYNAQGFVHDPSVPAYALANVDQAFHVEGVVDVLLPPAGAPAAAASAGA